MDNQRIHSDVFERIKNSQAEPYLPAARLADGRLIPSSSDAFSKERVVETPDYL